jgi:hypothetical protein
MDSVSIVRTAAGVLFVILIGVLILRRHTKVR